MPIELEFSDRERALVDEMRAIVGVRSDADLIRVALYRYAEFLQLGSVRPADFALEGERPRRRRQAGGR